MHYPSGWTWAHICCSSGYSSVVKTGTRRIMRLDELFSVVRRSSRTTEDSSSRRIMRLVPVFILEKNNQTNNKCLPKFVQTDNASSSVKTAVDGLVFRSNMKRCFRRGFCTRARPRPWNILLGRSVFLLLQALWWNFIVMVILLPYHLRLKLELPKNKFSAWEAPNLNN